MCHKYQLLLILDTRIDPKFLSEKKVRRSGRQNGEVNNCVKKKLEMKTQKIEIIIQQV